MLTIGADPELFLQLDDDGTYRSAEGAVPGTKKNPHPVKKGAVQVDGLAAEFNIEPASTRDEFVDNIMTVIGELTVLIQQPPWSDEKMSFVASPVALFDGAYFQKLPAKSKELGCDPDINAWTRGDNPKPHPDFPMRTGGGHIHVGWDEVAPSSPGHQQAAELLTKQLDATLFLLSPLWDDNSVRRLTYGVPGAYRLKPYGVEYRTLSNAWVSDEDLMGWIFDAVVASESLLADGSRLFESPEFESLFEAEPSEQQLLKYHDFLLTEGVPPLPSSYVDL